MKSFLCCVTAGSFRNTISILGAALCLAPGLAACGYTFQGSRTSLPENIQTIAIAPVENETTEAGLGLEMREAIHSQFERFGVVRVVDEDEKADAVLRARIVSLVTAVKDVTSVSDIELEVDLTMRIAAELVASNGLLLWKNNKLQERESYPSTSDTVVTSSSAFAQAGISASTLEGLGTREVSRGARRIALNDLVDEISRKLYLNAVVADF